MNEEYRLEKELTEIISKTFYNNQLVHKKEEKSIYSNLLPDKLNKKLLWINTPSVIELEEAGEDPQKIGMRVNTYEISLIKKYFNILKSSKINKNKNSSIVILTPYNEQKRLLLKDKELKHLIQSTSTKSPEDIIKTVDEFQGHEAEVTIISLVRNNVLNSENAWGFISEPERLNVMFSRAKYSLVIIGCAEHIQRNSSEKNSYLISFLSNFKQYGTFVNSEEFVKYE